VRTIAEGLGGSVTVTSEPDQGATFTLFLPRRSSS
jgi:signal transduction histidine kinase